MVVLTASRYGKDNVRLLKIKKDPQDPNKQEVIELVVRVLLEGEVEESYTKADNSSIVPTDTVKNTIYILAKQNEVWPIELFGATLANHFTSKYSHIHSAYVDIIQLRWTKYAVNGKLHPHSFIKDGAEKRLVSVVKHDDGTPFQITSGIRDLTVLKSTGSMFYGYNMDEYTTLKETKDRILSTDIDAALKWYPNQTATFEQIKRMAAAGVFDKAYDSARTVTLERFALENSASVQATMYNMAEDILNLAPALETVSYSLPNKHYFEVNLSWFGGLENTGANAEVYAPQSDPNGLIKCTVGRTKSKL